MPKSTGLFFSIAIVFLVLGTVFAAEEGGLPVAPLPRFNCTPYEYSPSDVPSNVNEIRPHNVKVIMSFGDSMTAAFAATSGPIFDVPIIPREDRFLSYAAGGGSDQYTVRNFLALYNNDIQGGATGATLPIDALFQTEPFLHSVIGLDVAISGAKVQGIPEQIDFAAHQLQTFYNSTVDFENDWKVATILIGANNLCVSCYNDTANTPETFASLMNSSIAQIYQTIPRIRVNILPMFNVSQVYYWSQTNQYCKRIWDLLDECPCLSSRKSTQTDRHLVNVNAVQYRQLLTEVVNYWQTVESDTFAVTIQPFSETMKIINGELTSDFDCFHPSDLTHAYLGSVLWNSMLLPPEQKPTNVTEILLNGLEFVCPDRNTFLQ